MASRLITLLVAAGVTGCLVAGCSAYDNGQTKTGSMPATLPVSTATAVLTDGVTLGRNWEFTNFKDRRNEDCIAVNYGGATGLPACNFEVDDRDPIDAAIQQLSPRAAAIYGEVAQNVAVVEVVRKSSTQPLATVATSNSRVRYFVVFAVDRDVKDIYVTTRTGRTSLGDKLAEFYAPG
jgi:hypothetical protein